MLADAADFFSERLTVAPVLAVLRGHDPHSSVQVAEVCWNAGVELVEVSLSHDRALEAVTAVCRRAAELGRAAGAGTVCTAGEIRAAKEAGASFVVAPGLARDAVEAARHVSLPYLPGVATPSEVQAALALGCRTLKLFPARELGAGWIRALAGPFPDARFVAVGGLSAADATDFVAAGAIGVGIGAALDPAVLPALLQELRRVSGA
jgi:2-dehydro-3-deoxyphosphogluconate aldolase / (4S)-4-hydroxy-2-oxoglutarate aldolase